MNESKERPEQLEAHGSNAPRYLPGFTLASAGASQQSVSQQPSTQPQATPIQYATTTPPLKDIAGWLAFFMVILGLSTLISITILFTSLLRIDLPYAMISIVMTPIVTILAINAAMAINARKKLGKRLTIGTLVASFVHTTIVTIISILTGGVTTEALAGFFFIIALQAIAIGLCYMYFRVSRRVKETLQEKQPADQQYYTKSQVAPMQPTATSSLHLNGIAGWLAFFMVVLALGGLLFAGTFFDMLACLAKYKSPGYSDPTSGSIFPFTIIQCILWVDPNESSYIVSAVVAPIVTTLAIAAVVAINMRKKLGKRLAIAAYIFCFMHQVLRVVFSIMGKEYSEYEREALIINTIGLFTIQAIVIGLFCLYFCTSRRVKETLIK